MILTIARADIQRLCGIDSADTSQDSAIDALLAAEQPVYEYALDPAVLQASAADAGLAATLTLGVAEVLAGRLLQQAARAPGAADDFRIGALQITAPGSRGGASPGERLAAQGTVRLQPYLKAAQTLAASVVAGAGDTQAAVPGLLGASLSPSVFDRPLGAPVDSEEGL